MNIQLGSLDFKYIFYFQPKLIVVFFAWNISTLIYTIAANFLLYQCVLPLCLVHPGWLWMIKGYFILWRFWLDIFVRGELDYLKDLFHELYYCHWLLKMLNIKTWHIQKNAYLIATAKNFSKYFKVFDNTTFHEKCTFSFLQHSL